MSQHTGRVKPGMKSSRMKGSLPHQPAKPTPARTLREPAKMGGNLGMTHKGVAMTHTGLPRKGGR
jgi:hypothetical protein